MAQSHMTPKSISQHKSHRLYRHLLMSTVATLTLTQVAVAQDAENATEQADLGSEVITIDAKADVLTGGVQINADTIERRNPDTLRDVLRQEAGVTVGSPLPVSQKIYVNGIEDTNLAVGIDGARQTNKTYHHVGTTIVDPGLLKSVKIETGVAPADAGPGALAGSISLETKDGRDLVAPGNIFGGFGKLSYNTNTNGFSEDLALGVTFENFDLMAYGTHNGGSSYKDGEHDKVKGTQPASENYLVKLGYTADNGYRLKFSANQFVDNATRSGRPNFLVTFGNDAPTEYRRKNYTLSFGDETPTDLWDPKISLAYTDTELRTTVPLPFGTFAPLDVHADVWTLNGKAQNTFTTDYGKITAGLDYYKDYGKGGRAGYRGTETTSDVGIYVQGRMNFLEGLRTSLGGRYDWNHFKGADGTKFYDNGLSANLNVEYDVTDELMVYGGASTAFGAVPLSEVGFKTAATNYDDLKTSRSYNTKFGAVFEMGGFSFDGNYFTTTIIDANRLASRNRSSVSSIKSHGVNLNAGYSYGDGYVRAGYSKSKVRTNSEVPTSTSSHYLGALMGDSVNFEFHHDVTDLGVRFGTTNEYFFENDDTVELTGEPLEEYFVSNVYAEYKLEEMVDLTLRLDVQNLFNATYADRANIGADSTLNTVSAYNEPGRTFLLSAKIDF